MQRYPSVNTGPIDQRSQIWLKATDLQIMGIFYAPRRAEHIVAGSSVRPSVRPFVPLVSGLFLRNQ